MKKTIKKAIKQTFLEKISIKRLDLGLISMKIHPLLKLISMKNPSILKLIFQRNPIFELISLKNTVLEQFSMVIKAINQKILNLSTFEYFIYFLKHNPKWIPFFLFGLYLLFYNDIDHKIYMKPINKLRYIFFRYIGLKYYKIYVKKYINTIKRIDDFSLSLYPFFDFMDIVLISLTGFFWIFFFLAIIIDHFYR